MRAYLTIPSWRMRMVLRAIGVKRSPWTMLATLLDSLFGGVR